MAKRRVTQIVHQRQRFDQVFIEPQGAGQRAGDRGDFERMREPAAVVIAQLVAGEDLRLLAEPAKRGAMDDAVAIALKRPAIRMRRLRVLPPARKGAVHRIGREQERFAIRGRLRVQVYFGVRNSECGVRSSNRSV